MHLTVAGKSLFLSTSPLCLTGINSHSKESIKRTKSYILGGSKYLHVTHEATYEVHFKLVGKQSVLTEHVHL